MTNAVLGLAAPPSVFELTAPPSVLNATASPSKGPDAIFRDVRGNSAVRVASLVASVASAASVAAAGTVGMVAGAGRPRRRPRTSSAW